MFWVVLRSFARFHMVLLGLVWFHIVSRSIQINILYVIVSKLHLRQHFVQITFEIFKNHFTLSFFPYLVHYERIFQLERRFLTFWNEYKVFKNLFKNAIYN